MRVSLATSYVHLHRLDLSCPMCTILIRGAKLREVRPREIACLRLGPTAQYVIPGASRASLCMCEIMQCMVQGRNRGTVEAIAQP